MKNNLSEIQDLILKFREDRDWNQFHKIKDLLLGLNIEVSELQELFLWKSKQEVENIDKAKIENEIADIFIYLTYIAAEFDVDLLKAVEEKIKLNSEKYPISKSKGSNKKYTELQ